MAVGGEVMVHLVVDEPAEVPGPASYQSVDRVVHEHDHLAHGHLPAGTPLCRPYPCVTPTGASPINDEKS
jgi:hypothetical protein